MDRTIIVDQQRRWHQFQAGNQQAFQQLHQYHIRHLLNRRWDLIRTGQYFTAMKAAGKVRENKHLLFPIPQRDIQLNPQLTKNPGW